MMFERFFPDEYVASTYIIPFEKLYEEGYRGVIFDIDNTLVPHGAPADERAKKLFKRLSDIGFSSCLLSNNREKRVKMFNKEIQTHYINNANKPSTKNYIRAMELMGTDKTNTVFVGDQLFTDVWRSPHPPRRPPRAPRAARWGNSPPPAPDSPRHSPARKAAAGA